MKRGLNDLRVEAKRSYDADALAYSLRYLDKYRSMYYKNLLIRTFLDKFLIRIKRSARVTVLDMGTGPGWPLVPLVRTVLKNILMNGGNIYFIGLDLSEALLRICKTRLAPLAKNLGVDIDLILADAFNPPLRARSFDVVTVAGLLEYARLRDLVRFLILMKKLSKSNSLIFLTVRNKRYPLLSYIKPKHREYFYHEYGFNELLLILRRIGFSVVNCSTVFHIPEALIWKLYYKVFFRDHRLRSLYVKVVLVIQKLLSLLLPRSGATIIVTAKVAR